MQRRDKTFYASVARIIKKGLGVKKAKPKVKRKKK